MSVDRWMSRAAGAAVILMLLVTSWVGGVAAAPIASHRVEPAVPPVFVRHAVIQRVRV